MNTDHRRHADHTVSEATFSIQGTPQPRDKVGARTARALAAAYLRAARNPRPGGGRCGVTIHFHLTPHPNGATRRPNVVSLTNTVIDTLTGIAWVDTSQIDVLEIVVDRAATNDGTVAHVYPLPDTQEAPHAL